MTRPTPQQQFEKFAKDDLERREPMMRAREDELNTARAISIWTPICVVVWLAFFVALYWITP